MKQGRKHLPYDKQKETRNVFVITMIISMFFSFLNVSAYSDRGTKWLRIQRSKRTDIPIALSALKKVILSSMLWEIIFTILLIKRMKFL